MSEESSRDMYNRLYTKDFPELGTGPVPVEPYVSSEYFDLECSHIFRKSWLLFCHETEIPKSGDYLVKSVPFLKASIIVMRGGDGKVRAFHNVCSHRGNKLVLEDGCGHARMLSCTMHSWSYGTDGTLRGVPQQNSFFDLDKSKCGLPAVTMDSWKGFAFINFESAPEQTLQESLGTLGKALEDYPFDAMRPAAEFQADVKANWKTAMNIFQEAYHVPTVHKAIESSQVADKSGSAKLLNFRLHGNHRSATLPLNPNFKPTPTEALASEFGLGFSNFMGSEAGEKMWPGLNPGKAPTFAFDINVLFPFNFVDVANGWYFTYEFWPISVNETRYITKLYLTEPQSCSARIGQEFMVTQMRDALTEDLPIVEANQLAMESGAIKELILSDQELAIRHLHFVLDSIIPERGQGIG